MQMMSTYMFSFKSVFEFKMAPNFEYVQIQGFCSEPCIGKDYGVRAALTFSKFLLNLHRITLFSYGADKGYYKC